MALQLAGLVSWVRDPAEEALRIAHHNGLRPVITSVVRPWREQARLRARFERCLQAGPVGPHRERGCRFPANRPGDSSHQWGLSFDSWVPEDQMATWVAIRRYVGFRVPENDLIHAEVPGWRQWVAHPSVKPQ